MNKLLKQREDMSLVGKALTVEVTDAQKKRETEAMLGE